jgi:carboxyl-terminal processing protease
MQSKDSSSNSGSPVASKNKGSSWKNKLIGGVVIAFIAFSLGLIVGGGQISFGAAHNADSLPNRLNYSSVDEVYNILRNDYDGDLNQDALQAGMKEGLAQATGDPYTSYFTPEKAKEFNEQLNGSFTGIGAELGQDSEKNLIVVAPISGTPADKAGVKPQDIIAEIDGQSTSGISVEEAVSKIRGKKGTQVKLTIIRNKSDTIPMTITRDDISVPSVTSKILDGNVGYIRVTTFSDDSGTEVQKEAEKLHAEGVKSVILDLRGNPGGRVDAADQIASIWLPQGKMILQEKQGNTVIKTHTSTGGGVFQGVPTVVLIDAGSASASEIVSSALLDNNAATLVGVKSYGKGSVQELKDLSDGGLLKVTVARWYRPNGQNIDKKGINPTKEVILSDDDAKTGNDTQLKAAQDILKQ